MNSILKIESARINGAKSHGAVTPEGKQASAANSAKSTGPTSPEGLARSSRNAIRYGMLAEAIVLDTECSDEFTAVLSRLTDELQPETGIETHMVEVMALAQWRTMPTKFRLATIPQSVPRRPIECSRINRNLSN
jgi:hypothetical protein